MYGKTGYEVTFIICQPGSRYKTGIALNPFLFPYESGKMVQISLSGSGAGSCSERGRIRIFPGRKNGCAWSGCTGSVRDYPFTPGLQENGREVPKIRWCGLRLLARPDESEGGKISDSAYRVQRRPVITGTEIK
jgi:hypothetical protein